MDKILTVSIAAYNAEQDIERCLQSFLQTDVADDLELIVVNDGSKDATADVVARYVAQYPDIVRLINKENGGHGSTINTSLQHATGRYYKVVDSDDWVDKNGIEQLVAWLREHDVDLALNPYYLISADSGEQMDAVVPYEADQQLGTILPVEQIHGFCLYMHAMTLRTEIVRRMGPVIDEHCFYVDMEYTTYPMVYVQNYACLRFPVYQYYVGTATQSMNMQNMIARRDQHLLVTKSLITYLEQHRNTMNRSAYQIVLYRIKLAALSQYKIYANMPASEAVRETRAFDAWLRQYPDIYSGAEGRFMQIIRWNRWSNFAFYGIVVALLQRFPENIQL